MRLLPRLWTAVLLTALGTPIHASEQERSLYSFSPTVLAEGLSRLSSEIGHRVLPGRSQTSGDLVLRTAPYGDYSPISPGTTRLRLSARALLSGGERDRDDIQQFTLETTPNVGGQYMLQPEASLGYDTEMGQGWTLSSDLGLRYTGPSDLTLFGDSRAPAFSSSTLEAAPDGTGEYRPFMKLIATFRF